LIRTNKTELVYLASPYTHEDKVVQRQRFHAVNRVAGRMLRDGIMVYSPISHTHQMAIDSELPSGWDFWGPVSRSFLEVCSKLVVLRLDGWLESQGVQAEIDMAMEMGMDIEFLDV